MSAAAALVDPDADPETWAVLVALAARTHDTGFWPLEPSPFFAAETFDALVAESATEGADGSVLTAVALAEPVHDIASRAAGVALTTSGHAAYQHDESAPVHLDRRQFPYIVHVVLAHTVPPGAPGSRLVVHGPEGPTTHTVAVGDAILLAGRGTLHRWEPLADGEHRTLIAVGLTRA